MNLTVVCCVMRPSIHAGPRVEAIQLASVTKAGPRSTPARRHPDLRVLLRVDQLRHVPTLRATRKREPA